MSKSIPCKILSPEKTLFEGDVEQIKLPLWDGGNFAVLNDHAPLLGQFANGEMILSCDGQEKKLTSQSGGIAKILDNTITILVK